MIITNTIAAISAHSATRATRPRQSVTAASSSADAESPLAVAAREHAIAPPADAEIANQHAGDEEGICEQEPRRERIERFHEDRNQTEDQADPEEDRDEPRNSSVGVKRGADRPDIARLRDATQDEIPAAGDRHGAEHGEDVQKDEDAHA